MNKYPQIKNLAYGHVLGKGASSTVVLVTDETTGKQYALKIIDKEKVAARKHHLLNEISTLKRLNHPNIVKLYEVYETPDKICLLLDYVKGGELIKQIEQNKVYTEQDAKRIIYELLKTVKYMHSEDVAHRDLKPENILLANSLDIASIRLADFGLACNVSGNKFMSTICGSIYFMAPEILTSDAYNAKSSDVWSIGVISFVVLCGRVPFNGHDTPSILSKIAACEYEFDKDELDTISVEAQSFVKSLLKRNPLERPSAKQALEHEFFNGEDLRELDPLLYQTNSSLKASCNISMQVINNLKKMNDNNEGNVQKSSTFWDALRTFGKKLKPRPSSRQSSRPTSARTTPIHEHKEFNWETRSSPLASSCSASSNDQSPSSAETPGLSDELNVFNWSSDLISQQSPKTRNKLGNPPAKEPMILMPPPTEKQMRKHLTS